jgi:hypothetical protein
MRFELKTWTSETGWVYKKSSHSINPNLVLCFYDSKLELDSTFFSQIKSEYPNSVFAGCSTSGEILQEDVLDESIVLLVLELERTRLDYVSTSVGDSRNSLEIGVELGEKLPKEDLQLGLLFSLGHGINGTDLLNGIMQSFPKGTPLCGGLAGDGPRFKQTFVIANDFPSPREIILLGFYGKDLLVKTGSIGGWNSFGPTRKITKSEGNVLFELDNKPALELYKAYLGEQAKDLPSSALLFPLNIFPSENPNSSLVRTILSIDEENQSMTFAGNMPTGYSCNLMTASFENLIEGAGKAAQEADWNSEGESVALLISCVGRRLVLGQRVVEEIEAVKENLGQETGIIGFYSYGEIAPGARMLNCELHNQTMTITHISEKPIISNE